MCPLNLLEKQQIKRGIDDDSPIEITTEKDNTVRTAMPENTSRRPQLSNSDVYELGNYR
jgi:hypothetical protein